MYLLMGLLHPDPRKRTSVDDCEKDLWVNQPIDGASSLKQQPVERHVAPLGHIILDPSQPVYVLTP
jgi:hypothetical protein